MSNQGRITSNEEIMAALTPIPKFSTREAIKPWIHDKLEHRGINLVIERSDTSKVVFKCKNNQRKSVTNPRKASLQSNGSTSSTKSSKRIRSVPEDSCPFRLRVSYSVKHKIWAVNIIKHEHNPQLCCNFGVSSPSSFSPSSTTPGAIGSGFVKRSLSSSVYTPASTVSPAFSAMSDSSLTPASDLDSYEHMTGDYKFLKRQKTNTSTYVESPLYQEIDPLDKMENLLPEDLSDINHFYESTQDMNLMNSLPLTNFDGFGGNYFPNDLSNFESELLKQEQSPSKPMFKLPIQPKQRPILAKKPNKKKSIAKKHQPISPLEPITTSSILSEPLIMQQPQQSLEATINPMNFDLSGLVNDSSVQGEVNGEDDPLMYLLNTGSGVQNSNYTIEELENLDKAMGFDDNDKFLMNMFQGM